MALSKLAQRHRMLREAMCLPKLLEGGMAWALRRKLA